MAEITKVALKVDNNNSFPNNNGGLITPAILRAFNVNMIDSMVDEIPFGAYTQSVNTSLNALNVFTASATGLSTGSLLVTASAAGNVITFTKGNNTTFNVTVATGSIPDISNLNQATASLQAYTASAQISINNLNTTTASLNTSVSNINTFTASTAISLTNLNASSASQQISIDNLNQKTGSYATTGSNTFVSANTFTSISASSFVSASQFVGDGSKLTGLTSSISMPILDEGVPQGNAVSLNFTGSGVGASVVGGVAIISVYSIDSASYNAFTASMYQFTSSVNSTTASQQVSINNLNLYTSSFNTNTLVSTASFNSYTSSTNIRLNNLESTSASVNVSITNLNTTTASVNTSITNLNASSASQQVSIDALNTYTASQSTASLVTSITNLNTFSASALVSISNLNASSASQQISIDALNTNSASVNTSISALNTFTASQSTASLVTSITNLNTFSASALVSISNINSTTASLNTSVTNINSATASLFTSASLALVTASFNNGTRNLTFTKGDNQTFSVNIPDVSGSTSGFATLGANTFTGSQTISSSISVSGSANFVGGDVNFTDQSRNINIDVDRTIIKGQKPTLISSSLDIQGSLTASLANGYVWVGDATNHNVAVLTSSFIDNQITSASFNAYTSSTNIRLNNLESTTASLNTSVTNLNTFSASALISISNLNQSSASQQISIDSINAKTGSFATTGSNSFIGNQTITGSLILSSSSAIELQVIGNMVVTGSAFGNVVSMSITSNTASMDLSLGNYFTLTLAGTATTHISASNVQPGVSATLVITTGTNSSASLAPTMLQPSGSAYSATAGSGKKDVLSIVAVSTGVPFVVSTLNMI